MQPSNMQRSAFSLGIKRFDLVNQRLCIRQVGINEELIDERSNHRTEAIHANRQSAYAAKKRKPRSPVVLT